MAAIAGAIPSMNSTIRTSTCHGTSGSSSSTCSLSLIRFPRTRRGNRESGLFAAKKKKNKFHHQISRTSFFQEDGSMDESAIPRVTKALEGIEGASDLKVQVEGIVSVENKEAGEPKQKPLRIMIAGAPASGKGTQCELITMKYGLVHIAAGDLLRAEVAAGSENGKRAKEYMEKGLLVPDDIVVMMVKDRLLQPDAQEKGWLLDGYPRSYSQAKALEDLGIRPDLFILLDVPEEILVERVVGRRLDPITGKIYHLKYSPPETEEIASRLSQRFDDTEEKVKLRLKTHHLNMEDVLSIYKDLTLKVKGNLPKDNVFAQIDSALKGLLEKKKCCSSNLACE